METNEITALLPGEEAHDVWETIPSVLDADTSLWSTISPNPALDCKAWLKLLATEEYSGSVREALVERSILSIGEDKTTIEHLHCAPRKDDILFFKKQLRNSRARKRRKERRRRDHDKQGKELLLVKNRNSVEEQSLEYQRLQTLQALAAYDEESFIASQLTYIIKALALRCKD
jgi:hypothetical protein